MAHPRRKALRSAAFATSILLAAALSPGCGKPQTLGHRVLSSRPHDPESFTQGLEFRGPVLLESSGGYGSSTIRATNPQTGEVLRKRPMAPGVFAEGISVLHNRLWVLSWRENTAFALDPDTLGFLASFRYEGEGWGLTNDGRHLIMSDGTARLRFLDPQQFTEIRSVEVTDRGKPVTQLNELEYADGVLYANIWQSDRVARIHPSSGKVTGWLDLSALRAQLPVPNKAEALNGIARDPATGRFLVTGKLWPRTFEIEITGN